MPLLILAFFAASGLLFVAAVVYVAIKPSYDASRRDFAHMAEINWYARQADGGQSARADDESITDMESGNPVAALLRASRRCGKRPYPPSTCEFDSRLLRVTVLGVGSRAASVVVDGSDEVGGYGVGVLLLDGCVRVAPGLKMKEANPHWRTEDAFISTWTGEVYETWTQCRNVGDDARKTADQEGAPDYR